MSVVINGTTGITTPDVDTTDLTLTGDLTGVDATLTGDISLGDNDKAIFGAGSDLQIYHDGTRSYVDDTGTGSLWLRGGDVAIKSTASETMADFANNGAVQLYHDNSVKLATSSSGVTVTGTVAATAFTGDGSGLTGVASGAGSVEAWVNFNCTGTVAIRDDGNVSTITDNGTGDYTISFSTAISSANYAPNVNYGDDNNSRTAGMTSYESPSTSSNRVYSSTASANASDRPFYSYSLVI